MISLYDKAKQLIDYKDYEEAKKSSNYKNAKSYSD